MGRQHRAGFFWCDNLEHTRRQLLERGYNFKVVLKGSTQIGAVSMPVGRGSCVIKERIPDSNRIAGWISRLPQEVSWNGERTPGISSEGAFCLAEISSPITKLRTQDRNSRNTRL